MTVAYYWADRPYNVYHWISPGGDTLGWYFNVSGPVRISERQVEWQDLEVDVLVTPDLRCRVLDEDRLPEALGESQRTAIAAARARALREYATVVREVAAASHDFLARSTGGRCCGPGSGSRSSRGRAGGSGAGSPRRLPGRARRSSSTPP